MECQETHHLRQSVFQLVQQYEPDFHSIKIKWYILLLATHVSILLHTVIDGGKLNPGFPYIRLLLQNAL